MSIEEMLESDDYEIFELGISLKEKRDGAISIVDKMKYMVRLQEKLWNKIALAQEKQLWGDHKMIKKYESK